MGVMLPQAAKGHGWVAVYRTDIVQELQSDDWMGMAPTTRTLPDSLRVYFAERRHFSQVGLGVVDLCAVSIPLRNSVPADAFQGCAARSTGIGSAASITPASLKEIIKATPLRLSVAEQADQLDSTHEALYALTRMQRMKEEGATDRHEHTHSLIITEEYGVVWVPTDGITDGFVKVACSNPKHPLLASHKLVDVLLTKWNLFQQLGLDDAIALDKRHIEFTQLLSNCRKAESPTKKEARK